MKARASSGVVVLALLVSVALVAAGFAREARAQAYKYKDENGHVHFTENLYDVPEKYRKHLETREMPTHVDPAEAAKENSKEAVVSASVEDGVRAGLGRDLTIKQQDALHAWLARWMWAWIGSVLLNCAIALGMAIHAFVTGKLGWGLANLFVGVSSPFYLMIHLEQSIAVRIGLLAMYLAPFIVLAVSISELVRAVG